MKSHIPSAMSRSKGAYRNSPRTVLINGKPHAFLERRRIGRRDYYLLRHVGSPLKERYLAFDSEQGLRGSYFLVQTWPQGPLTRQQLRVAGRLTDDSLPRVVDRQWRDNRVDIVFSWVEGITLEQYFENIRQRRRPPVSPSEAVRLVHGLANGVCKLHNKYQLAHGDIQPSNIIVTGHSSRLVLIDFGSAWTSDNSVCREEGDGVNRYYAAPELQTNAKPVGFFADQFSVSILLYELLTGQLPYGELGGKAGRPENIEGTKDALVPPSRLSDSCRQLPRSLWERIDGVTLRGLALDPKNRYPDRRAWLDDLFAAYAQFRLPPQPSATQQALLRVKRWFMGRRPAD